ncbi:MAG: hypothetical protein QME68_06190, partial [Elusimicrobiota bacterium]|nr:hypothetical protein [Elusimicrobiota bacterium]
MVKIIDKISLEYISSQRWFLNKSAGIKTISIFDRWFIYKSKAFSISGNIIQIDKKDLYYLPLIERSDGKDIKFNWTNNTRYFQVLFQHLQLNEKIKTSKGNLVCFKSTDDKLRKFKVISVKEFKGELSNTVVFVGNTAVVKTFRHLNPGINPDLEIHLKLWSGYSKKITDSLMPSPIPKLMGYVYYKNLNRVDATEDTEYVLAMIEEFVPNSGDCFSYVLKELKDFFSYVRTIDPNLTAKEKV